MDSLVLEKAQPALTTIWLATVTFVVYRYRGSVIARRIFAKADIRHTRIIGILFLAILPALFLSLSFSPPAALFGLGAPTVLNSYAWVGLSLFIIVPIIYRQAQTEAYWLNFPELRQTIWDKQVRITNALSWIFYLLAYEYLFRGLLLFSLLEWVGQWPAISITSAMYVLSHVDKSQEETLGSIPMSLIFAFAALGTGSIWLPWLMHSIIAIASDSFAMRANPQIKCEP